MQANGYRSVAMPVPRSLSSSCGTCIRYEAEEPLYDNEHDEIEQIVQVNPDGGYSLLYRAENS